MSSPAILTLIAAILLTPGISASASQVYMSQDRWVNISQSEAINHRDWPIRGQDYKVPISKLSGDELDSSLTWDNGDKTILWVFKICWIKPAANIPTINERTKANGRGRGRGDGPGIDGKWYYDSVEDECSVFLWSIDNVVRYRGYRGVSVHVDSGAGQENCAEIIRKIKVIMNDRRRTGLNEQRKETLVTGSLVQWVSGAKNILFSLIPKDFLHPQNEFVLLTTPQYPLQALDFMSGWE